MGFDGHLALITGAGQGIGRACAEVFAQKGADLILLDKNPETLAATTDKIASLGRQVVSRALDLTDVEALQQTVMELKHKGRIDILVNNAGFDRPGTIAKIDSSDFLEVLGIHLVVPFVLIQLLLPEMRKFGWGRIINVSSIYALIGAKAEVAYSTAKAGVIGLTKAVAKEAGKDGVTVNAVLPGLTRTPTIETFMADKYKQPIIDNTTLGRMGEAEEIAGVIAFLASDEASFITATSIPVSGGWGI
ncbi:MAG: SDR family NAD(P)-dependent oxidoreductase [Deltaproteobacteria bacterium]